MTAVDEISLAIDPAEGITRIRSIDKSFKVCGIFNFNLQKGLAHDGDTHEYQSFIHIFAAYKSTHLMCLESRVQHTLFSVARERGFSIWSCFPLCDSELRPLFVPIV